MNVTHSDHKDAAAEVAVWWQTAPRRYRRAAARWYWSRCHRSSPTWGEFWTKVNNSRGVVHE